MGKKGSWFSALKKALSSSRKSKSKKKRSGQDKSQDVVSSFEETVSLSVAAPPSLPVLLPAALLKEDAQLSEAENEQSKHAYSVAVATAVAAEAAVAAAQAAAEVVRLTTVTRYTGKPKEEIAAIKIQTAFRGYMARRALRALRGLVRLKTLIQGQSVKRQATSTLRAMQTLARVQSQIRARRITLSEENQALQRQLQQKQVKELEKMRASTEEQWDVSSQSKEQVEASLLHKQEAAMRRERALAYAFSHQQSWKHPSKSANPTFMDPSNPHWGWSWLERWTAARPWETRSIIDNNDHASIKSARSRAMSFGEDSRVYSRHNLNHENNPSPNSKTLSRPTSRQSLSTPPSRAPSTSSVTGKTKPPSPRGSAWGGDDDSRSMFSVQSERYRRHSIAGSSVRDDESLASSPSVPSFMAPTQSAKAKSRLPSPLGREKNGTPDKASAGSAKKRLSFSASPAGPRRHSGPPRVDVSVIKNIEVHSEERIDNGGSSR